MIEIRNPNKTEKNEIINLWQYCFSETEDFLKYYFNNRYEEKNTLAFFENEYLCAMLHLNKYKLNIRNINHTSSYVVGVSVAPDKRGSGYMSKIINKALNIQYENGEIFSILMPIETSIYTRYGYANCFDISEFSIDLNDIKLNNTNCTTVKKISDIDNESINSLNEIYNRATKNITTKNIRDTDYWINKFGEIKTECGEIFLIYEDGSPKGYFNLFPKNKEFGLVTEMCFLTKSAYNSILNIIKSHSTQFKKVKIFTPQYKEFFLLSDSNNKYVHIRKPFMMGRVINAKKVLENILKDCKENIVEEYFEIEIKDENISENNFVYKNENAKYYDNDKNIKINISALSQLYTKFATLEELELKGEVISNNIKFYKKIFGNSTSDNFINEYF